LKKNIEGKTFWFHATRVFPGSGVFKNGILPLQKIMDEIWGNLFLIAKSKIAEREWEKFKQELETNSTNRFAGLYRLKVSKSIYGGPWGFLIKDLISKSQDMGNHDYLRTPEIVEDICACFDEKYGENLQDLVFQSTKPCIVKFIDNELNPANLGTAFYYLYSFFYKLRLNVFCNNCYDGKGMGVKKEDIYKIEFL
jgi:hypothetical protein